MHKKKGEMAMGTLIIFIAMVLIAAVAAGVLISTTSSLQSKALETGKATRQEVGTNLQIIEIFGEDASDGNDIENITVVTKLAAGSDSIRFSDLLVTFSLASSSTNYEYDSGSTCDSIASGSYAIDYSLNGTSNVNGYITSGDVVKVCFSAPSSIGESSNFRLSMIPKTGTPYVIESQTPELMSDQREVIYP